MKSTPFKILLASTLLFSLSYNAVAQDEVSGVYVGGHIRRERPTTITKLRESGFTYVILFNVNVEPDGTLTTDGETICKDGKYVFTKTQPYYQSDVRNLKTAPTSITRIEICIGGWGNTSYSNIKSLIEKNGTGENTILNQNFKALKEAVPQIDGVNNDDEHCYDVNSAAKFHVMMYDLGYKTTLAPYTNQTFWTQLNTKIRASRSKAVDRVMIQCYDGGAYNNPSSWTFTGVTNRHAGRTNYQTDMKTSIAQMETWYKNKAAVGGFVWVYNDETWNLNEWASAMNRTFHAKTTPEDEVVLKCYSENNYGGYCVNLPKGQFTKADLAVYGLTANDLASIEVVKENHKVYLYTSVACTGAYFRTNVSKTKLTTTYNNKINSIKIVEDETAITGITEDEEISIKNEQNEILINNAKDELIAVYNISGHMLYSQKATSDSECLSLSSLPNGIYIVKVADKTITVKR